MNSIERAAAIRGPHAKRVDALRGAAKSSSGAVAANLYEKCCTIAMRDPRLIIPAASRLTPRASVNSLLKRESRAEG